MTKKHGRYQEPKTRFNISLTATGVEQLDSKATQLGLSRSELIEQFARGQLENIPRAEARILGELSAS